MNSLQIKTEDITYTLTQDKDKYVLKKNNEESIVEISEVFDLMNKIEEETGKKFSIVSLPPLSEGGRQ